MRHLQASAIAAIAGALLTAAGCSRDEPAPVEAPPLPEAAQQIRERLMSLDRVDGLWGEGDASSHFEAWLDGESVVFIEERMAVGDYGDYRDEFYFADGELFHYRRTGVQREIATDGEGESRLVDVRLEIDFTPEGKPTASAKTVDGAAADVEDFEIVAARRHARTLEGMALAFFRGDDGATGGYYVLGERRHTFQPCGGAEIYWVVGDEMVLDMLRQRYEAVATEPYQPVFARVVAEPAGKATEGPAADTQGLWKITEVREVRARQRTDCR